jgi:hypothetical protein
MHSSLLEANPFHAARGGIQPRPVRRRRRPSLFHGWIVEDGRRRRATRAELRNAYRLWVRHADIREGRA